MASRICASSISASRGSVTDTSACLRFTELSSTVTLKPFLRRIRRDRNPSWISFHEICKNPARQANQFSNSTSAQYVVEFPTIVVFINYSVVN